MAMEAVVVIAINRSGKTKPISSFTTSSKSYDGICGAHKNYSFDCDATGSAEQANKTLAKMTDHLGMTLGNDVQVALETRQKLTIPAHPADDPGEIVAAQARKKAQFE
jgi:hypothetical protein